MFHVVDILSFVLWISEKKNPHKKLTEIYVDESPRFIRFKTVRKHCFKFGALICHSWQKNLKLLVGSNIVSKISDSYVVISK